jgi:very-short-patch-repair endonuclease
VVHETRHLPPEDLVTVDGLAVTSHARTLCDLAAVLRPARLTHLVERQLARGEPEPGALVACHRSLARQGRAGSGLLRSVLDELLDEEPFPQSQLELAMCRLLRDAGLDGFERQYRPPWFDGVAGVVDFAHPGARVILEVDGRRWHTTTQAFGDDRRRDRVAVANGWRVLRYGWQEVVHRPSEVAREVSTLVGRA